MLSKTGRLFPLLLILIGVPLQGSDGVLPEGLSWRALGPAAFGGRISDVEAVADNPDIIFVGAASGGVFRSTNGGTTWEAVFDRAGTLLSIGDVAVAPSDSGIVWVGTGEANNRQSSSWGDGVYRSLDGGRTWQHRGLQETHHIGRIVIHPSNPRIVFVAALGHLWGPNPERGLYRTRDGGETWELVLSINEDTGVVDVAMEENGRVLYAAAYQRRRRAWGFVGGGPHGALYRSLNGGDSWERLDLGLPEGDIGRIGVSICPSRPNVVYAIVEHKSGGVFRSDDRGESWRRVNELNPRPMYYSQIRCDPLRPERVWVLGSPLFLSIDGGQSFTQEGTAEKIHVDHHALWIHPRNPDYMLLGNDGGLYVTHDGARNWRFIDNLPLAQYYDIGIDSQDPYWIYGGTQDNGTWALPSRTRSGLGITNRDVRNIAYGDGFYAAVDPRDPQVVFAESQNGRLYFVDLKTGEEKGIRPEPENQEEEYRFNWSSPLLLSPHDPDTLYYGGNKLFRSRDRGAHWEEISPDLTRNQDWKKLPVMGVERNEDTLSRDDGIAHYGTITSISESPLRKGLLYVGTDDGRVHMSLDGGGQWRDLTQRFSLPGPRWVSRVLASRHGESAAFVSFDGHQDDDFSPYLFFSQDGGESWHNIGASLPEGTVINAVAEHPAFPNLLLVGAETGFFISWDRGRTWSHLRNSSLPTAPVDDLIVAENGDLILGTHGRGIFVLDDMTPLAMLQDPMGQSGPFLFPIRPAETYYVERALPAPGAATFAAPNPDYGALITFFLKEEPAEDQKPVLQIETSQGEVVRRLPVPGRAGLQRVAWDLRHELAFEPEEGEEGWFGPPRGPFVLPGLYTVRLTVGSQELTQPVQVLSDSRSTAQRGDLEARWKMSRQVNDLLGILYGAARRSQELGEELERVQAAVKERNEPQLLEETERLLENWRSLHKNFQSGWRSRRAEWIDLLGQLQASSTAPTQAQERRLRRLHGLLRKDVESLNRLAGQDFPDLLRKLREDGSYPRSFPPLRVPDL